MLVAGFDPGVTGAAVVIDDTSLQVLAAIDLPIVRSGKLAWVDGCVLADWLEEWQPEIAVVELVTYWPGDRNMGNTSAMVRLAGGIEAVLSGLSLPFLHAAPSAWKRRAGLLGKGKPESMALARARLSWPHGTAELAKHHNRAEAGLIALFGRAPAAPAKARKRSKIVDQLAAQNLPPGSLFGGS
jgi:crossover junction endodeoxyribonuclease RuvC